MASNSAVTRFRLTAKVTVNRTYITAIHGGERESEYCQEEQMREKRRREYGEKESEYLPAALKFDLAIHVLQTD